MQVISRTPNLPSSPPNPINPRHNFIFCNSNYSPPFKRFTGSVFPTLKLISTFPNSTCFATTRRRRFPSFTVTAKRQTSSDYYSVLNVSRNATLQEIKSAYRNLARKVLFLNLYGFHVLMYYVMLFNSICTKV